jgi:prohibitin 1
MYLYILFRAKFIVQKSEEEKKITVIRAEAESESARLINESIATYGRAFLELKRLEAAKDIVENLSKSNNVTYLPGGGGDSSSSPSSSSSGQKTNFLYKL